LADAKTSTEKYVSVHGKTHQPMTSLSSLSISQHEEKPLKPANKTKQLPNKWIFQNTKKNFQRIFTTVPIR